MPAGCRRSQACKRGRVQEILSDIDHKPTEISGGQMQRVAIARALAMDPAIVLADEPTGNLDSSSGSDIMTLFEELWQQGSTLIVITHDPALARRASRVVEIRDGEITEDRSAGARSEPEKHGPRLGVVSAVTGPAS